MNIRARPRSRKPQKRRSQESREAQQQAKLRCRGRAGHRSQQVRKAKKSQEATCRPRKQGGSYKWIPARAGTRKGCSENVPKTPVSPHGRCDVLRRKGGPRLLGWVGCVAGCLAPFMAPFSMVNPLRATYSTNSKDCYLQRGQAWGKVTCLGDCSSRPKFKGRGDLKGENWATCAMQDDSDVLVGVCDWQHA